MANKYQHVALGGTFDLLHKGHISILEKAFKVSQLVSIGITTDKFCKESGKNPFESQTLRRKNLLSYLKNKKWSKRARIIWLNDIYGTTAKDKTLEAIVVSKETIPGANEINKRRTKSKLKKLTVITCPQVFASDKIPVTSTRIRSGEISQDGLNYHALLLKIAGVRFNNQIRAQLKKPFGKFAHVDKNTKFKRPLISVGDVTTQDLLAHNILPDISIVDFFVNRQRVFQNLAQIGFSQPNPDHVVKNAPGQISKDLILAIQKSILTKSKGQIILVDGEEDLAFIPALLLCPFPATIFYGQPEKGEVIVPSSVKTKEKLFTLLQLS